LTPVWLNPAFSRAFKFSVGVAHYADLLGIEGLFTQQLRPGWTFGESVGGSFEMDSSDWSNGIRYQAFDTRSDTEFKRLNSRCYEPLENLALIWNVRPCMKGAHPVSGPAQIDHPGRALVEKVRGAVYLDEGPGVDPAWTPY